MYCYERYNVRQWVRLAHHKRTLHCQRKNRMHTETRWPLKVLYQGASSDRPTDLGRCNLLVDATADRQQRHNAVYVCLCLQQCLYKTYIYTSLSHVEAGLYFGYECRIIGYQYISFVVLLDIVCGDIIRKRLHQTCCL